MKRALVCGLPVEPIDPEDRPYPLQVEQIPPADMACPKCGHTEIRIELRATVVVPFQKRIKVDPASRQTRKACCASCGWNIRELVKIS